MTIDALRSLENEAWPVRDANADADLLDTSSPSPTPVQEDYLTRLDRVLTSIEQRQARQEALLLQIIETLAEDEDPDDMPATYLDGSRV